jgi:hypothetical protein
LANVGYLIAPPRDSERKGIGHPHFSIPDELAARRGLLALVELVKSAG